MMQKKMQNTQLLLLSPDNCYVGNNYIYLVIQGDNGVFLVHVRYGIVLSCLLVLVSLPTQAGVFESINPVTAKPVRWANPQEIPYSLDQGPLGQLDNQQASELVEAMMAVWENEGGGAFHFANKGALGTDVTVDNMADFVDGSVCTDTIPARIASMIQGQSPIIFDTDGSIIDAISGPGASRKIVGKAAFRCFKGSLSDPQGVTQAFLIMNGRFIDGQPDPADLPINVYAGVILHELGHYLGLHHSMVNEETYTNVLNGIQPAEDSKYVPVMYPMILPNSIASTVLKPDDTAVLRALYPTANDILDSISGSIVTSDGVPVKSANVVARRTDDSMCQAVSAVSGRECTPMLGGNGQPSVLSESCSSENQFGNYSVHGLTKGKYTVEVSEVANQNGERQNMFPKSAGQDLPGEPTIVPSPLTLETADVNDINFRLDHVSSSHHASIDESIFLRSKTSDCKTDPVDYGQLVSLAGATSADSSASLQSPAAASSQGCTLIPEHQRSSRLPLPLVAIFSLLLGTVLVSRRSYAVSRH